MAAQVSIVSLILFNGMIWLIQNIKYKRETRNTMKKKMIVCDRSKMKTSLSKYLLLGGIAAATSTRGK